MSVRLSAQFAITHSRLGDAATMQLHGELDLAVAPQLIAEFQWVNSAEPAVVIVDLRDLYFLDARGMRALIDLRATCEEHGRRFVLIRGQRPVQRLLAVCDCERTFELVDSAAEALELAGTAKRSRAGPIAEDEPIAHASRLR